MTFDSCIKDIELYLHSDDTHPRFVNFQNTYDLNRFKNYYHIGSNKYLRVEDYCKDDENPSVSKLYHDLGAMNGNVFLIGFITHFMLMGMENLNKQISRLMSFSSTSVKLVVICYQCDQYLEVSDPRQNRQVYHVEGDKDDLPTIKILSHEVGNRNITDYVDGVHQIAQCIEQSNKDSIYLKTNKTRNSYESSIFNIIEQGGAYCMLCDMDGNTRILAESLGTKEQWQYALDEVGRYNSWLDYTINVFGNKYIIEYNMKNWNDFDVDKRWIYFIILKLYGAENNNYLNYAAKESATIFEFIRNIYVGILDFNVTDSDYWARYYERKRIIKDLGKNDDEENNFCTEVGKKEKNALYYLTDLSYHEKNKIFGILDLYYANSTLEELSGIFQNVFPDLALYLNPFDFQNNLLNDYFQKYKLQKVINKILPEFKTLVEEQAEKREYNRILPARTEKTERIPKKNTELIFMDAMGVEFLGFIMEKCRARNLMANVTVCRCELPSITSMNKEFISVFKENGASLYPDKNGIKDLDDIKHHGNGEYDYRDNQTPIHLSRELEIIDSVLEKVKIKLEKGSFERVVLISDHGASRLAVINEKENRWEMSTKSQHSGRCCPKSEISERPTCATEENDFWVLANYDRFRGGRRANVEVHGGASLEEVTIPIIEITYIDSAIEVEIVDTVIEFSTMKKDAEIKLFSKKKMQNVSVEITGKKYLAESVDGQNFIVALIDLKKAGDYEIDVYTGSNKIASGLKFTAKKKGISENKLF